MIADGTVHRRRPARARPGRAQAVLALPVFLDGIGLEEEPVKSFKAKETVVRRDVPSGTARTLLSSGCSMGSLARALETFFSA
ncbi:hypothetical protein [Streptomyces sp. NPDC053720]|uniref:hypothetical protein n=1 Tax=Streptomyces sp. NPDC053720 TaxID=3154855 RepID=UPI00342CD7E8